MANQTFIDELAKKLQSIGTLKAVGETWISIDGTVPAGGVPYCGQTVTRAMYADLFAWATAAGKVKTETEWQAHAAANGGNCPYYSSGDGSTTFRMPAVVAYLKGATSASEAGTYKAEGLPDHKHFLTNTGSDGYTNYGYAKIYSVGTGGWQYVDEAKDKIGNASESNSIYGNSDHVQPETFTVLVGVYAVGIIANIGGTDVTAIQTALAALETTAVKSVNGINPVAGNVQLGGLLGLPDWSTYAQQTETQFTATSNGMVILLTTGGGNRATSSIYVNEHLAANLVQPDEGYGGHRDSALAIVAKGNSVRIVNQGGTWYFVAFA